MKILVTGCNGQVGRNLVEQGTEYGWSIIGMSKAELDVGNGQSVLEKIELLKPDLIVNAAAFTCVDAAETSVEAAYRVNRDGAGNLARHADSHGIPIFHLSTDYVFDGKHSRPYVEHDKTAPLSVYGASKRDGEAQVQQVEKHLILRTSWVYGAYGSNFLNTMLRLTGEKELRIVDDQVGCPTSSERIASVLLELAQRYQSDGKLPWGLYHFSGQSHCSWFEFAQAIFDHVSRAGIIGRSPRLTPITTEEYPTPAKRPAWSVLDCRLFESTFGISPTPWRADLQATLQSLKADSDRLHISSVRC
ncbi:MULTISPECIES: dTDP-4-dehydrorhamnose reductase [Pseudomonadales]|nr:dTDP-4-dehydrorhamnose reductase [Pseudomonas aeruginosa]MDT3709897.1 dTDP-4-dehydrorhamnose reductase [Pseudomonadaceae bacterium]MBG5401654.1 dTDP-4-dehydrorhamnose reductase [Pseudomonas aeruginosa]MBH4353222.1 dTDP-4-dehydrorhamnose reductase [Pseudomonas aeruginosa]MCS8145020.1 dTDP-4-dehydrorhamnose reductase [Pseudomonas aeruginosa]MCT5381224.1 dTDP-4-dehydrorhamnose reductase [Pseudomonas aeruginosa]